MPIEKGPSALHAPKPGEPRARSETAPEPTGSKVQRRGNDAILDSDDCQIIVYELFGNRG